VPRQELVHHIYSYMIGKTDVVSCRSTNNYVATRATYEDKAYKITCDALEHAIILMSLSCILFSARAVKAFKFRNRRTV